MRNKIRLIRTAALGAALLLTTHLQAQTPAAVPLCNACHGPNGVSPLPTVPTIAGLSALVLENALVDYREGNRSCDASVTQQPINMCAPVASLADADIAAIARYYAALPFVAAAQPADAAKAALGKAIHDRDCEICHSQGGSDAADDTSILAGQRMDYLRLALVQYQAGVRMQPRPMAATTAALSPADIDALVHFYASRQ